jgi:putative Holliday junction resolvase
VIAKMAATGDLNPLLILKRAPARCGPMGVVSEGTGLHRHRLSLFRHDHPGRMACHLDVGMTSRNGKCYAAAMPAPILPLVEAAAHWPPRGALIGLDLGTKTIGVAASDPDRRLATAVETIAREKFARDAARLLALAEERRAVGLVLGLPVNMDGSEGPRAQSTRSFARNLAGLTGLPIALWDERLSTAAVERALIAADASRAKRAQVIDAHAAAYILQGALDRLARLRHASS